MHYNEFKIVKIKISYIYFFTYYKYMAFKRIKFSKQNFNKLIADLQENTYRFCP